MKQNNSFLKNDNFIYHHGNEQEFSFFYYEIYPFIIHELINKNNCNYKWINFFQDNIHILKLNPKNYFFVNNPYIKKSDILSLGEDILANGMYFPFFIIEQKNSYFIRLGKHRAYSLLLQKEKFINNNFLAIFLPINRNDLNLLIPYEYEIGKFKFIKVNTYNDFFKYFLNFSDFLGDNIYYYKNNIKPNLVFNKKILFEEFINDKYRYII